MPTAERLGVEYRLLDALIPYARNARTHSDAQVAQIAASIREFGWTNPVLVDGSNGIIAGHGRVLAARKLGIGQIPCIELSGLTDAQKRAYILADNKLAENAGWDIELLSVELGELQALDFDLGLIGFGDDEIAGLLDKNEGLTDPDDVPEPPAEPVTVLGDVWTLGRHRLVCGDATSADDVAKCLNGVAPHLMVTDPPYGVEYDPAWRSAPGKLGPNSEGSKRNKGASVGVVLNDHREDWTLAWALFPGDVAYVWHGEKQGAELIGHFSECGFEPRSLIVWAKDRLVISRGHYHPQHEGCWYLVRKGKAAHWAGDRKQSTLWQIPKNMKNETGHSTQKPVECMRRPIVNNSSPGQAVYDPFLGSGTTIIAAEMEGRACHGLEISPAYCDVIVERWQNFTGEKATRLPVKEKGK